MTFALALCIFIVAFALGAVLTALIKPKPAPVPPWVSELLNRRVVIENEMLMASKAGETWGPDKLHEVAVKLGTPRR